jgi:hypothetical protein
MCFFRHPGGIEDELEANGTALKDDGPELMFVIPGIADASAWRPGATDQLTVSPVSPT